MSDSFILYSMPVYPGALISRPAHPLPRQGRSRTATRASSRPRRDIAPSLTAISSRYRGLRRIAPRSWRIERGDIERGERLAAGGGHLGPQ